jgi:cbb3-type cytochrome oxidase subunit 3
MLKKNLSTILIILLAMLLIAVVIWMYDKRIKKIEAQKPSVAYAKKFR